MLQELKIEKNTDNVVFQSISSALEHYDYVLTLNHCQKSSWVVFYRDRAVMCGNDHDTNAPANWDVNGPVWASNEIGDIMKKIASFY